MLFTFKPTEKKLERILQKTKDSDFSYKEVGSTFSSAEIPKTYASNIFKYFLGQGDRLRACAEAALRKYQMYKTAHSEYFPDDSTFSQGTTLLILSKQFLIWSVNPIRIVYMGNHKENGDTLFSIGAGTLYGHEEHGEERFSIRFTEKEEVWFEIFSFYKPSRLLTTIASPLIHHIVKQFDRESSASIAKWVCTSD